MEYSNVQDDLDTAEPIAHGDPENGFIVEHHDGETHRVHPCQAESRDDAIAAAKREWEKPRDGEEGDNDVDVHSSLIGSLTDRVEALEEENAGLKLKLDDHDRKFSAIHDALAKISEPVAEAASEDSGDRTAAPR